LVRKTDLFKAIRRHITTREQAFTLVRDLDYCADIYSALRDAMDARWQVDERQALKQLLMFGVRQPLAMLLSLLSTLLRLLSAIIYSYPSGDRCHFIAVQRHL
jgi:HD superfamily phosphohydrolase YqeK